MNVASYIENTLLRPDASAKDYIKLFEESMKAKIHAVCIPPERVMEARQYLASSELKICTVIGFPYGYSTYGVKYREACEATEAGADELDMVMPIGMFKDANGDTQITEQIMGIKKATGAVVKVIIETPFLNDEEIFRAAHLCRMGKADFVKTCTGIHGGATHESIPIIREAIGDTLGIKASGGIGSYRDALTFIDAGAERIGTSKGYKIWKESLDN